MKRINLYTVKQVKEQSGLYELDSAVIRKPSDASDVIQAVLNLNDEAVEKFGILTLNTKNKVVGVHVLSIGTLSAAMVHPRNVFQAAILNNAASIVLFHNHPSGDPTPSNEDIGMTKRICEAGELMGIEVLDHIITGDDHKYSSLKEKGLM